MATYRGKTPHQSARDLIERMKLAAAQRMSDRYAEACQEGTEGREHWDAVSSILHHQTDLVSVIAIYDQAEQDDNAVPQKPSKSRPTAPPSPAPEVAAEANPAHVPNTPGRQRDAGERLAAQMASEPDPRLERVSRLVRVFDRGLTSANTTLAAHAQDLKTAPTHAMEWSLSAFTAAARMKVYAYAFTVLTDGHCQPTLTKAQPDGQTFDTVAFLRTYAQDEVNRRARMPSRSTNPTKELMEQEILGAWAEVIEAIDQER